MMKQSSWAELGLNCLEVNTTFYRLPGKKRIENLLKMPSHVSFIVKASRYISHVKRLKDVEESWGRFRESVKGLGKRDLGTLLQLPPSFRKNDTNVDRILDMGRYVDSKVFVEFRDSSWLCEEVYDLMRQMKWTVVSTYIDKPEGSRWIGTMPAGLFLAPETDGCTYIRVHGGRGYRGEMGKKLRCLKEVLDAQGASRRFVLFNNYAFAKRRVCDTKEDIKAAAVCDACKLRKLTKQRKSRKSRKSSC